MCKGSSLLNELPLLCREVSSPAVAPAGAAGQGCSLASSGEEEMLLQHNARVAATAASSWLQREIRRLRCREAPHVLFSLSEECLQHKPVSPSEELESHKTICRQISSGIVFLGNGISDLADNSNTEFTVSGAFGCWLFAISAVVNSEDCPDCPCGSNLCSLSPGTPEIRTTGLICTYLHSVCSYRSTYCIIMGCQEMP